MCEYPQLIKNPKYIPNKKNGGQVPPVFDNRVMAVPIQCGRCRQCKIKKSREWQIRMWEEIKRNKNGIFVTLTFTEKSIIELIEPAKNKKVRMGTTNTIIKTEWKGYDLENQIAIKAVERMLGRWRKEHGKSMRHWLITELGHNGTERIHLHGIIWTDLPSTEIQKHWQYGNVWIGKETAYNKCENYVNEKTINYITKYITKQDLDHKEYVSKILCSAGIGRGWEESYNAQRAKYQKNGRTLEEYVSGTGHKMGIPIYYRNKIYTEEEREKLWVEKLDKNIRWVGKQKIDVSESYDGYYSQLNWEREKSKRLGYATNEKDWSKKKYEEERRNLLMEERRLKVEDDEFWEKLIPKEEVFTANE